MTPSRAALLSLALLAACSTDEAAPPLLGGFAPADGTAVIFAPTTCDLAFVGPTAVSAVAVAFTSTADACALLTATRFCGTAQNSTAVIAVALAGEVGGSAVGPAGPGAYPVLAEPPGGAFRASTADAARVDAACAPVDGSPLDVTGGRIVLDAVEPEHVQGSMSFGFEDGSAYEQAFDVGVCPLSVDLCALFRPCFDHVCVAP